MQCFSSKYRYCIVLKYESIYKSYNSPEIDVDATEDGLRTPLHLAYLAGHTQVVGQ